MFLKKSFEGTDNRQKGSDLVTIRGFLQTRTIPVEKCIVALEEHMLGTENTDACVVLKCLLEKIAHNLLFFQNSDNMELMTYGLMGMLSILFQYFEEDSLFFDRSVLRQVLIVCATIPSCIWKTDKIESLVCCEVNDIQKIKSSVAKDVLDLQWMALSLNERTAESICEDLMQMQTEGPFCKEFDCYNMLRGVARSDVSYMKIYVRVRVLQLTMLWHMYAVSKLPGDSDELAHHLHSEILNLKKNDCQLISEFLDRIFCDDWVTVKYHSFLESSKGKREQK